jgi:hypothetical protein
MTLHKSVLFLDFHRKEKKVKMKIAIAVVLEGKKKKHNI